MSKIITRTCGKCNKVSTDCFFQKEDFKSYNFYNRCPSRGQKDEQFPGGEKMLSVCQQTNKYNTNF